MGMLDKMDPSMRKVNLITELMCLFPILPGAILYRWLPEQLPIHFNVHDVPDTYMGKAIVVFVLPFVLLAIQAIMVWSSETEKKKRPVKRITNILIRCLLPAIAVVVFGVTYAYGLGVKVPVSTVLFSAAGLGVLVAAAVYFVFSRRKAE